MSKIYLFDDIKNNYQQCAATIQKLYCSEDMTEDELSSYVNLTYIALGGNTIITNQCINNLYKLTSIMLGNNNKITNEGIMYHNLESLSINARLTPDITDVALMRFVNLKSLHIHGNINDCQITDRSLMFLVNLELLHIDNNTGMNITDYGIKHLVNLTELFLSDCNNIGDNGISELRKLVRLYIKGDKITNQGLQNLINLTELYLQDNNNVTPAGIANMLHLKSYTVKKIGMFEGINSLLTMINHTK